MVKNRYKIVEGGVTKILFYWVVRKLRARTVSNCNVECKIAIWRPWAGFLYLPVSWR